MVPVNRKLSHRQRQAQATQQLVIEAAQALFLEQGYGATTIDAIAKQAGVAVSTVYAIFTNKLSILKALRETWHQSSHVRDIYEQASEEPDSAKRLELYAHATRRQWEEGAAMIAIYTGAAAVDAEAAAELQEALSGRRKNLGKWLGQSVPLFRQDLTTKQIIAIHLALTRAEVFQELVDVWGWTPGQYETWLADTLKQQFLA